MFSIFSRSTKFGAKEPVLQTKCGDFIGVNTGSKYSKNDYYTSPLLMACVTSIQAEDETGMIHLDDEGIENKKKWLGAYIFVREAHYYGSKKVFHCQQIGEYFSENELTIIGDFDFCSQAKVHGGDL